MLRDYQNQCVAGARDILYGRGKKSALLQLPTGAGKTAIVSEITKSIADKKKKVWFVVPRNELLKQSAGHFAKWKIPHSVIDAKHKESRAYNAHIISLQTLIRRLGKIKNWPDFCFFDEAHVNYAAQKKIIALLPEHTKIVGLSATPERLSGEPLADIYDEMYCGPSIPYLQSAGFLCPLRYYAPPTEGVKALKFRSAGEVNNDELDKLLTERAVYGRAAEYYAKLARLPDGSYRRGVGFCAGVKAAEKQAAEFRARGFNAEYVSGGMPEKKQRALIDGIASGRLQVLCAADLLLYGWDSPHVSYGFLLRRTKSRALYFQIVGRILRTAEGKSDAIFVDHTATVDLHTDPAYPGVPPFFLDHVDWRFYGAGGKRKPPAPPPEVRLCPYDNYMVCVKRTRCPQCEKYVPRGEADEEIVESVPLQERVAAGAAPVVSMAEKREYQDAVAQYVEIARTAADGESYDKAVKALVGIAKKLDYSVFWVYWRVTQSKHVVDAKAVHSIARVCGYKKGWCYYKIEEIKRQIAAGRDMEAAG
ncbi:MAG: DEAD/DEAH box helicase [Spirochaetaceae bacterium]|jgi:superfamily II DNA or RNA helicase|nr:DEAD/DEAH box helicase [Spirochaetaceae bacterium]